jgi:hypothetical protein
MSMGEETRTIYGDGRILVEADQQAVVIHHGADAIDMSRAAFREVCLGWERLQEEEQSSV